MVKNSSQNDLFEMFQIDLRFLALYHTIQTLITINEKAFKIIVGKGESV